MAIIAFTGHANERSLADYEEGDENEQQLIASIISSEAQASSNHRYPLEGFGVNSAVTNTLMIEKKIELKMTRMQK